MHQELEEYPSDHQGYEGVNSLSQQADSFPMSAHASQQGDNYSMHSSPSPSPPSGTQPQTGAGRQRSRSGTAGMTMQQLNKKRQRATPDQLGVLEEAFLINQSPNAKMRELIAERIRMTERSVQIWFQNRRAKVKQMQKKEGVPDESTMFFSGLGQAGMVDHMKRNALMRSNSLGHGTGYSSLPPDIRNAMRMGLSNGPLTPASSPSNKQVISRLSIETLSIGSWHRIACTSMDLVCYFSPMEGRFTYYINNSSTGFKIEFPVAYIRQVKLEHVVRKSKSEARDEHRGCMMIELIQPPLFYSELRGTAGWQLCHDFTQGLVASQILQHALVGQYEVLHAQLSELAAMCPDLSMRLYLDGMHSLPFVPSSDEDQSSGGSGDRSRRHSSAAAMGPPSHPSALPAQLARQHLAPGPSIPAAHMGGARPRPAFQAHRRTRSRSLPTSVNVSDLAFAASQSIGSNIVPGMKYGHGVPAYVPLNHEMLYNPATPLRIDTSVAESPMDYYRQFTPSSNMSAQMTPVDFTSPVSQVPLHSSLPFYEGPDFHSVGGTQSYAHSSMYSTESMESSTVYTTDPVGQSSLMGLDHFQASDSFAYTPTTTSMADTSRFSGVGEQQWAPHGAITKQMETDSKEDRAKQDELDSKMEMGE